jgi:glutathione peroxidase
LFTAIAGASVILGAAVISGSGDESDAAETSAQSADVLDRSMTTITGEERSLEDYRGNVILIVNTASKCGLTPQYKGLESLYESHKDKGFVILGFPANNFGKQEPGSDEEIAEFCEQNYGVSFPMFSKISVKGDDIHPLYKQLTTQPAPIGGKVQWNFQKYIVDREGNVVAMFGPRTKPDDLEMVALIETLLDEAGG